MTRERFMERFYELEGRSTTTGAEDAADAAEEAGVVWDEPAAAGAGVQAPEPKRLTEERLNGLAKDAGLWVSEMRRAAQALGYEIAPIEVELPGELTIREPPGGQCAVVVKLKPSPWHHLSLAEARAVAAWWGQRSEVEAAKEEAGPGNAATRLRRALAAPARAARGEE